MAMRVESARLLLALLMFCLAIDVSSVCDGNGDLPVTMSSAVGQRSRVNLAAGSPEICSDTVCLHASVAATADSVDVAGCSASANMVPSHTQFRHAKFHRTSMRVESARLLLALLMFCLAIDVASVCDGNGGLPVRMSSAVGQRGRVNLAAACCS